MASNPPGECCTRGVQHDGTPAGEIKDLHGTQTYFAYPQGDSKPEHAVLFLSDVIGIYPNSQLLADGFASNGYLTMVPDLFRGNAWQLNAGSAGLMDWLRNHQPESVDPIVEAAIRHLREERGIKKIAAVGYCFGAKVHSLPSAAHEPTPTWAPLTQAKSTSAMSLTRQTDSIFPANLRHQSEEILRKTGLPYQINLYSGVEHSFAVRGDLSKKQIAFAREQAFIQAVTWFKWHLSSMNLDSFSSHSDWARI
ncbi:conserved hypothetical protein [Uncinocarpus reesii 1704]|uniref:Dienelactone hydrolase domain-containing protein n=1 Tax=Uncinocarpus reesii (strain UAMH 1704) TaxID=336963 RepID=C4JUA9_UNCRE|nr:uncharacterized protein UREG_06048 [Uncinocarpus reesii 1704]EEP81206.1 conserved hypothetical protein [Uncinocarpus reesii 1704]